MWRGCARSGGSSRLQRGRRAFSIERHVRGFFSDLISEVLPVDVNVADVAANLRSRRQSLRMPDAMILATAEIQPEVGLVVTGDIQVTKVAGLRCEVQLLH